jgi:hypothetical protein
MQISRRTVLRGLGTAVALPWLEAMLPQTVLGGRSTAVPHPKRMGFVYVPNGVILQDWTPQAEGSNFVLPRVLEPLAPHKSELLVLSGLTCDKARANGDGPGDHARASGAFLTGAQARKTSGANFRAGVSADQVAALRLGDRTRLPSIEIAVERFRGAGNCDSGYSCVYQHTLAWRNATSPVPSESDPSLIFDRLFSARNSDTARQRRESQRASVLDAVREDTRALQNQLGGTDQQRLDQYLTNVRDLEQRIQRADALPPVQLPAGAQATRRLPADLSEHFRLTCDLVALAFQTDVTRIATCMFAREGSSLQYRMAGVTGSHHELTHHQNDAAKIASVRTINIYHIRQFAYLIDRLKAIREGEGTLLDNCMIAYGSAIGDGNRHTHHDLPILVAGKAGGTLRTGRHVRFPRETPLNNLWLAMLDRFGARTESLGDSTGVLQGLS